VLATHGSRECRRGSAPVVRVPHLSYAWIRNHAGTIAEGLTQYMHLHPLTELPEMKPGKSSKTRLYAIAVVAVCVWLLAWNLPFSSTVANAQEAWAGYGVGAQGCGTYLEQRRRPNKSYDDLVGSWFYGFISAYNYYGPKPQIGKDVNQDTVLAYLDKYCRDAPLASVAVGTLELVKTYVK
jgi:hypothetical protein